MNTKRFLAILIFSLASAMAFSQSALVSGGGNSISDDGSFSYSVGQTFYNILGENITVTEGVQQPYEISEYKPDNDGKKNDDEEDDESLTIGLSVYPNPAVDYLNLTIGAEDFADMECLLYDELGKCLYSKRILSNQTLIDMQGLSPATYFVRVMKVNEEMKTFKIVKN